MLSKLSSAWSFESEMKSVGRPIIQIVMDLVISWRSKIDRCDYRHERSNKSVVQLISSTRVHDLSPFFIISESGTAFSAIESIGMPCE